jgi:hypothetical protein
MQSSDKKTPDKKNEQEKENENISAAHKAADEDIEQDPDLSMKPEPGDDLDEGELARLEGED